MTESQDIPVIHIRQTRMITVKLAGATFDWLYDKTSWGNGPGETQTAKEARVRVMAADNRTVGKGRIYTVSLRDEQAESLWGILDAIAGNGESMTSEERGSDDYAFRVMRRDAERIRESLEAIGWKFVRGNWMFEDAVPPKEDIIATRYTDWPGERADVVVCQDCSTRRGVFGIPRDEIAAHDAWHEEE